MTTPYSAERIIRESELAVDDSYGDMSIDDLIAGFKEMTGDCKGEYDKAEEYYEGTREEFFADRRYKQALDRTGTTFRLNYAKTPVDALVDRLEINGISTGDPSSLAILEAFWEENQMDLESLEIHRRACEFGDAYILVWPTEEADEEYHDDGKESALDDSADDGAVGIEAYYNDPRTMRIFYDPENPRRKHYAMKLWMIKVPNEKRTYRANLYYKGRIEKYIQKVDSKGVERGDWQRFLDDDDIGWPLANPYDQIPVFHFRTNRPYGTPVHKEAYGPQDVITKLVITHMNTIDYHGFPQRFALAGNDIGDDDDDSEDFAFEDDLSHDTDPLMGLGGGRSALKAKPGYVWFLKNIKSVGQFDAAKSDVFLLPLVAYIRSMAQVSRTPVHKFDFQGNPPSGESLRVAEQPFVKKGHGVELSFTASWNDMLEFVLRICKIDNISVTPQQMNASSATSADQYSPETTVTGPPGKVTVTWASTAVNDDQLAWDLAIMKLDAGVPLRIVLSEIGYTKKQLDAWGIPPAKYVPPALPPGDVQGPNAGNGGPVPPGHQPPSKLPQPRLNPIQETGKIP